MQQVLMPQSRFQSNLAVFPEVAAASPTAALATRLAGSRVTDVITSFTVAGDTEEKTRVVGEGLKMSTCPMRMFLASIQNSAGRVRNNIMTFYVSMFSCRSQQ
jgi:hypothetical protein